MGKPYPEGGDDIPLSGHVTELRKRILWVVIPMLVALPAAIWKAPLLLDAFFAPIGRLGCALYRYRVTDGFILTVRAALLMVITAFMPWIVFQAARFIWPGLYRKEKWRLTVLALGCGTLFIAGVAVYLLYLMDPLAALWYRSLADYASRLSVMVCYEFQLICFLVCGIAMMLPVVAMVILCLYRTKKKEESE